jgi:hypothetical protein
MLRDAEETVLVQLFPSCAEELREDLQQAVERGRVVAGLVMHEEHLIEGSRLILSKMAPQVLRVWPGDQLTIVIDAREFLLALFDRETGQVKRAISVTSPYVASLFNNGIVSDVLLHSLHSHEEIASPNRQLFGQLPPGLRELLETAPDETE